MIQTSITFDELKTTTAWRSLTPTLQRLLTICLTETENDIVSAIKMLEPTAEADQILDAARRVLSSQDVQDVVNLYVFGLDSHAMRGMPFAPESVAL
jgi:hypothetical protein